MQPRHGAHSSASDQLTASHFLPPAIPSPCTNLQILDVVQLKHLDVFLGDLPEETLVIHA